MDANAANPDEAGAGTPWALFAPLLLVLAGFLVYANSFSGAFVYDDLPAIRDNPTIRSAWPPGAALSPPREGGLTVSGRPVLNYTFAVNYAVRGLSPRGYHAVNLTIHLLAGLLLYGVLRRILPAPPHPTCHLTDDIAPGARARERHLLDDMSGGGRGWNPVAWTAALLWMVHPLQTEAVTYIVQRAESLMGFFYLLTLYAFVRGVQAERAGGWWVLSVGACFFGMATKEVMVSAPVLVLLLDRTCFAGTFAGAWRQRRGLYAGLAASWVLLAWLVASLGGNRGGSIGPGLGLDWWGHWITQFRSIGRYLGLTLWPHPLIFDYGVERVSGLGEIWFQLVLIGALLAGTVWALRRRRIEGVLGAWFFAVLAPTSLMPGPIQMTVEHRLYLALAPLLLALVLALHRLIGSRVLLAGLAAAIPFGVLTWARNRDYVSEIAIWGDTVAKRPDNRLARYNYGSALMQAGRLADAVPELDAAIRLKAGVNDQPEQNNLASALMQLGRSREALPHYEAALRGPKPSPEIAYNLGLALFNLKEYDAALARFEQASRLKPELAPPWNMQAVTLGTLNRVPEAVARFEEGLRRAGPTPDLCSNLGLALMKLDRLPEAVTRLEEAVKLQPSFPFFQTNLGIALARSGRLPEAVERFREAIRLNPDDADPRLKLGAVLQQSGRTPEALASFEEWVQKHPDDPQAHEALAQLLSKTPGREFDAARHFAEARRLSSAP